MALIRLFLTVLGLALVVEAGIFYLLLGLGARGELIVGIEMIWLGVACAAGGGALVRYERRH